MRILATASLVCLLALPGAAKPSRAQSIANVLKTRRISIKLDKAPFKVFVKYLRTVSGLNIVVSKHRIEKDGGDVDALEVSINVKNVRMLDVMRLVLEQHELGLKLKGNVLLITSKKDARGKPVLVLYSVADVLMVIRDFPAPDINIYPSSYEPPEPPEPEVHQAVESADELAELVRQFTGRETWEDEGIRISVFRRHLFIRQYPAVHREIRRFLAAVRGLR